MPVAFLWLAVAAASPNTLQLALPGLQAVNLDEKTAGFYGEHLAQQMKLAGAQVLTQREIQTLLGLERQKQLLGCSPEATSCMAELANALGAEALVLGDLAKLGDRVQLNLKIVSAVDAKTLALFSDRAADGEATLDALSRGARALVADTARALKKTLAPVAVEPSSFRPTSLWWAPVVAGAVAAGTGAVFLVQSGESYAKLERATAQMPLPSADAVSARDLGKSQQTTGTVFLIAGAGLAAVGAGLLVAHLAGTPTAVAIVPTREGAAISLSGSF